MNTYRIRFAVIVMTSFVIAPEMGACSPDPNYVPSTAKELFDSADQVVVAGLIDPEKPKRRWQQYNNASKAAQDYLDEAKRSGKYDRSKFAEISRKYDDIEFSYPFEILEWIKGSGPKTVRISGFEPKPCAAGAYVEDGEGIYLTRGKSPEHGIDAFESISGPPDQIDTFRKLAAP